MAVEQSQLQLPMSIVGYSDVGHLLREAESVDNFLRQGAIRETGTPMQLPKTSKLFEELVDSNKLNLLEENDRTMLLNLLKAVRSKAPVVHMSFNSDPSPIFLQRLITWMRQQIHPFVLLQIGLNPSIGAGCVVRTTNKFFDFSLRHRFSEQRELLIRKLKEGADSIAAETEAGQSVEATTVAEGAQAESTATEVSTSPTAEVPSEPAAPTAPEVPAAAEASASETEAVAESSTEGDTSSESSATESATEIEAPAEVSTEASGTPEVTVSPESGELVTVRKPATHAKEMHS